METQNKLDVTDEELIQRFIRNKDESAIDNIITRYRGPALKYASCILRDRALAEDAVQETFIRVVTKCDNYYSKRSFSVWFYTILRHICIDIYRKEIKRSEKLDIMSPQRLPEVATMLPDQTANFLEYLGGSDREILTLRFIHGMHFEEIAEYFSISVDAAKKRVKRALVRLKNLLNQENER